jgi:hypothetical protein
MTPEQEKLEAEKQRALEVEQKQIDDAKRVKEFLADSAVADALRTIEKKYVVEFHAADSDEKRRDVWAKTKALTDLVSALDATLDSGKFATHARSTRLAAEDRAAARTTRK